MKDHHLLAILAAATLALCVVGIARSGVVVTEQPGQYTRDGVAYESGAACALAARDGLTAEPRACEQVNRIVVTGDCADVAKPPWPADQGELKSEQDAIDDTVWHNFERDNVPAPYPACWQPGWVELKYPDRSAPLLPNVQEPVYRPALAGGVADGEGPSKP